MNYELGITNGGTCLPFTKRDCPSFIHNSSFVIRHSRRAFTIVELLMVIGIISVLITITFSAVTGSMKRARYRKASALCKLVEQGIHTYYAQTGKWPVEPGEPQGDSDVYVYDNPDDVANMVRIVVEQAKEGNPMIDVSGLFVSTSNGEGGRQYGMDFMTAIHGSKKNAKKIKLKDMYFGYPEEEHGYFRRFHMKYSPATDKVTVTR